MLDSFRKNICYLRKVNKMTQKDMAQVMGICVQTFRKIEKGDPNVRANDIMIRRMCRYFSVSVDKLVCGDLEYEQRVG